MGSMCSPLVVSDLESLLRKGPILARRDGSLAVASLAVLLGMTIEGTSVSFLLREKSPTLLRHRFRALALRRGQFRAPPLGPRLPHA